MAAGLDGDAAVATLLTGALVTAAGALLVFPALAAAVAGRLLAALAGSRARLAGTDLAGLPLAGTAPLRVLAAVIGNHDDGSGGGLWQLGRHGFSCWTGRNLDVTVSPAGWRGPQYGSL